MGEDLRTGNFNQRSTRIQGDPLDILFLLMNCRNWTPSLSDDPDVWDAFGLISPYIFLEVPLDRVKSKSSQWTITHSLMILTFESPFRSGILLSQPCWIPRGPGEIPSPWPSAEESGNGTKQRQKSVQIWVCRTKITGKSPGIL